MTEHLLRAFTMAGSAGLAAAQSVHFLAQSMPGLDDNTVMKFIEKGGGWAVLLVVLWVYRRDYKRLSEGETDRVNQLIALHIKSAQASQEVAVALTESSEILRTLSNRVSSCGYDAREERRGTPRQQ